MDTWVPKTDEDFEKPKEEEIQRLSSVIINGDDNSEGIVGKAIKALTSLRKESLAMKNKKLSDDFIIPDEFRCPISNKIFKDPVVLSINRRTYDRASVEKGLMDVIKTFPRPQEVLSDLVLTSNDSLRGQIIQWFKDRELELLPTDDADRKYISYLLLKLSSTSLSDQKLAAKEIRKLTEQMPSCCSFFGESDDDAMTQLLHPLASSNTVDTHPDLQEDLITALLNISMLKDNKKVIASCPCVVPLLVQSSKLGTLQTRTNAAAVLSSLSELALKHLLELLKQEQYGSAMKNVVSVIYSLCKPRENRISAIKDGVITVIFEKIKERVYVSEMLEILSLLSSNRLAADELQKLNAVRCLLSLIKDSGSVDTDRVNIAVILENLCRFSLSARKDIRDDEKVNKTISKLAENRTTRAKWIARSILNCVMPNKSKQPITL